MKLSVKGLALTCGIMWALGLLVVGLLNRLDPTYGRWFLVIMDSIYPFYRVAYGLKNLAIGVIIAFADGAIVGALFACLYNCLSGCCAKKKAEG